MSEQNGEQEGMAPQDVIVSVNEIIAEELDERMINGDLDMVCTYPEGYLERQAVFSCLTCQAENDGQLAGICYACSENCHAEHEIVHLYTKRNFCCDCGNSKFKKPCTLFETKSPINRKNVYNHNYKNLFCACENAFPPAEDHPLFNEEMMQCIGCEDWFHGVCIGVTIKNSDEDLSELLCKKCAEKYPFLLAYQHAQKETQENDNSLTENQSTSQPTENTVNSELNRSELSAEVTKVDEKSPELPPQEGTSSSTDVGTPAAPSAVDAQATSAQAQAPTVAPGGCYYRQIKGSGFDAKAVIFDDYHWRSTLCKCDSCTRMYEDMDCEYITNLSDSFYEYLSKNAAKEAAKPHDLYNTVEKISNPDVAHHVVSEIAHMKRKMAQFLSKFESEGKVVTADDVHEFFDGLESKRRRLDDEADKFPKDP